MNETAAPSIDYIVCPNCDESEWSDDEAKQAAECLGWDANDAEIVRMPAAEIGTYMACNGARRRVREANEWTPIDGWFPVLVLSWDDYHEFC